MSTAHRAERLVSARDARAPLAGDTGYETARPGLPCRRCQVLNPAEALFCEDCGAALDHAGRSNGEVIPGGASSLALRPHTFGHPGERNGRALEDERKQVTVLFADLKGSMEMLAGRDPEEARRLLDPVLECMMEAVHRYEGTVNQVMGDGIMALFGAPLAHEDHAVRACYAALQMRDAVRRYAEEVQPSESVAIQIRIGLNSGEVVVRSIGGDLRMDYTAVGQATHLAARVEQLARPGSILLTSDVVRLVDGYVRIAPLGAVSVKGLLQPVEVFELTGAAAARTRIQATAPRGLSRFVGRDGELERLQRALDRAAAGHGQVVALVGEPGVGKSRLVHELIHSHRTHGWLVLESGAVSYGRSTAYLPVVDLLRTYFQIDAHDGSPTIWKKLTEKILALDQTLEPMLPVFLALLGVPGADTAWEALAPAQRRQRTIEAIRRLLFRESRVQPVLLVLEDLHWLDPESQVFLDSLVASLAGARCVLLVNYRPEYQHSWAGKSYYTQFRLDRLPEASAEVILQDLLGDDAGLQPLARLLSDRTEGNPFFLEESVRTLVETGILVGERGAYRPAKPPASIRVPATVQAVLAARIDRLPPEEKRLLQSVSVIGKGADLRLLEAIADMPGDSLDLALTHLQAAELLLQTRLFPDPEYTFKHTLTYEVAYGGLVLERKKALHAKVVAALGRLSGDQPPMAKPSDG
jgi:class 3 adenylate cyclase